MSLTNKNTTRLTDFISCTCVVVESIVDFARLKKKKKIKRKIIFTKNCYYF